MRIVFDASCVCCCVVDKKGFGKLVMGKEDGGTGYSREEGAPFITCHRHVVSDSG
jgi:hypothetical protein